MPFCPPGLGSAAAQSRQILSGFFWRTEITESLDMKGKPFPPCPYAHTHANLACRESMAGAHCCNLLSFILKPTGTSRNFPSCALAAEYFCSLIKKIKDDHRGRPQWACLRFTNDKWGFCRVADDWFDQLNFQAPSTTCHVRDCSFCNGCVCECVHLITTTDCRGKGIRRQ